MNMAKCEPMSNSSESARRRIYRHFADTHTRAQSFCDENRSWSASEQLHYCEETQNVTELLFYVRMIEYHFTVATTAVIVCAMENTAHSTRTEQTDTQTDTSTISPSLCHRTINEQFKWLFALSSRSLTHTQPQLDVLWLGFRCCHPGEQHFGIWFKFECQFVGAFVVTRLRPVLAINADFQLIWLKCFHLHCQSIALFLLANINHHPSKCFFFKKINLVRFEEEEKKIGWIQYTNCGG